jgi:poly(hydroxyalkanoate) granule-associated protein
MATETTTKETLSSNVQPISSMTGTMEYSKNVAAKSLATMANSSRFMWRAWLGTAVAGQESATHFAQNMAKKGEETEQQAREKLHEKVSEARFATMKLRDKARARMDILEERVGKRMCRSLHFMGVPTRGDVDKLALLMADMSESIDELTAMRQQLQQQQQQQQPKAKRPSTSS